MVCSALTNPRTRPVDCVEATLEVVVLVVDDIVVVREDETFEGVCGAVVEGVVVTGAARRASEGRGPCGDLLALILAQHVSQNGMPLMFAHPFVNFALHPVHLKQFW